MPLGPIEALRVFTFHFGDALAFYTRILELRPMYQATGIALFDTGQCKLILEAAQPEYPEERALVGRFVGVSFAVEDIERTWRTLRDRGVVFDAAPTRQDWGGLLAHFEDLDGNVLTLVQYPP